jgi:hypothetical protein
VSSKLREYFNQEAEIAALSDVVREAGTDISHQVEANKFRVLQLLEDRAAKHGPEIRQLIRKAIRL